VHNRNLVRQGLGIKNSTMQKRVKSVAMAAMLCGPVLLAFGMQEEILQSGMAGVETTKSAHQGTRKARVRTEPMFTSDDGLAVISAALDTQRHFASNRDCSHLVHAIYERAGFPYQYATADDLYNGVDAFRRVFHPQIGDLIVWHGHVGIIVRPSRHVFFSFLSAGPGTDNYRSAYWTGRGEPRFYRYIKK
jgi:cell wall-associated NlpC family hydrolase